MNKQEKEILAETKKYAKASTPPQRVTDEEIEEKARELNTVNAFVTGAKWMRDSQLPSETNPKQLIEDYNLFRCNDKCQGHVDSFLKLEEGLTKSDLIGLHKDYIKSRKPSREGDGWVSEKPEFTEDCWVITRTKEEYEIWEIKRVNEGEGWYMGWFDSHGDEYGDLADMESEAYFIIPKHQTK